MREIVADVFTWPWFAERFGYDFNGYLVRNPGANVVIDPVEMADDVLEAIAARGVAHIALTNRNHFRAAARVRERTGARVAVHPADAAFVRDKGVVVDDALEAGGRVGPLVVVPAPGKSPGEVALHWPDRRILFVGDVCVGKAPGVLGILSDKVIDDKAELVRSLARLAADVDFDTLLVGDGHSILHGARAVLATFAAQLAAAS